MVYIVYIGGRGTESDDDMYPPYWTPSKEGVLYGKFVIVGVIT